MSCTGSIRSFYYQKQSSVLVVPITGINTACFSYVGTYTITAPSLKLPLIMDCSSTSWKPSYSTVVFDLIDVLFTWSPPTQEYLLPPKVLRSILPSVHWFEYEKAILSEDKVYASISAEFGVEVTDVKSTLQAARETLQKNNKMLVIDRQLKESGGRFTLSQISRQRIGRSYQPERTQKIVHALGERKPNIGVYKRIIKQSRADAAQTIFVDGGRTSATIQ
ncbi:hypothetical protein CPB84DRAFT_1967207 [Gymnopilus junonius]|uniref:Uncharacterized protein n=1 Tax=Gymnopilus junonius TaxID=109634 RepID=A0A9P5TGG7_GYMJU|nr:hypothetical protein CPB84DRAFT_1967207 [Gymnopilus junonius]